MDHAQLLRDLGGPHAVHAALSERGLDITPVAVRAWALGPRNIPAKYWSHIRDIAAAQNVDVSFEGLADAVAAVPPESAAA